MKLYYAPGTCSLVPHILLRETGTPFSLARVDLKRHLIEGEGDLHAVNPKGKVPVLELADGRRLTEGPVIAQFIAERAGDRALLPDTGDPSRYRVLEWQAYISSELHKCFSPLFNPALDPASRQVFLAELRRKFVWIDAQLADRGFLHGSHFTLADAYLFTVAGWSRLVGPDLADLRHLQDFLSGIAARPAVQEAMRAEGMPA
ncbi:glutathione transferase GstA [Luteimonas marina]|uniref:Glutathione transferase GstA n=1 Tax=Luteimonas marina TaxID=488485 RepID=A0A5C5UCK1_9GAMM|nr:glutathione transferase GstA [Luteimonas marina]TWT23320.1 glutathione transferase GstA [Luteimonas marina]